MQIEVSNLISHLTLNPSNEATSNRTSNGRHLRYFFLNDFGEGNSIEAKIY